MRIADALVTVLRELEVAYVFGVSGANIEHIHDAIHRLGDDRLRTVLAKREDGAACMADGRARIHRTLGVCCATSGGGMVNLVAGLAESYAESVPVLALVGQPPVALEGRGSFQDSSGIGRTVDAAGMLAAVTKKTVKISDPDTFWAQLRDTIETALSGRMGPVALLLPRDCYDREVGDPPADWPRSLAGFVRPVPFDEGTASKLFLRLREANSPVLLLGHGVRRSTDPDSVVRFAREARVPVVTTMGARGEFPNDDPLHLGVVGTAGHPSAARYLIERADLIVVVGTGLGMMTRAALPGYDAGKVVAVNIDPGELLRSGLVDSVVRGDAGEVFGYLRKLLDAEPFTAPPVDGYATTRYLPRLAEPLPGRPGGSEDGLLQSRAIAIIGEQLPQDGHLLFDAGNCSVASMHYSSVPAGSTSTIALGMGGMGYSIGGAIGAQLGEPSGTRTVVFAGDGAFLMSGLEIHTAVELGLPILYIVFNNGMHGMCATRQQTFFESRIEAVGYTPVDVAALAAGLGTPDRLWVGRAGTADELVERLAEQRAHAHLPGVLELSLTREEIPPFANFLPADAPTYRLADQENSP
ncbi:thiamine pyrophosphate-binding protein [Embleya sp. NBC_00896]|uniref:thiamine pyrophosphate-binding protein n=1 Tax=Embleya sp. NBC_00896 TaxID=2975961 RepID=UPI002F914FA5|nr:thiamine pyrophosphate-binding protein [Embleya sp. NBC_00896]